MQKILFLAFLALLAATPLFAQVEKIELKYREVGADGYHPGHMGQRLEHDDSVKSRLTGIPDIEASRTLFVEAQLGAGPNNRFAMMVVISPDDKSGSWVVDTNRNLDLSDDDILTAEVKNSQLTFPSITFDIPMHDREVKHKAYMAVQCFGRRAFLYLRTDCYRWGEITLDEERFDVALVDQNGNGIFNENGRMTDQLQVATDLDKGTGYIWSNTPYILIHKGRALLFDVDPAGFALTCKETIDDLATLTTNFKACALEIESPEFGHMNLNTRDGRISILPGEYRWTSYFIHDYGEDKKQYVMICASVMNEPLNIREGENHIDLCFPLHQSISCRTAGDTVHFDQELRGGSGESVNIQYDSKAWSPKCIIEDAKGNILGRGEFKPG